MGSSVNGKPLLKAEIREWRIGAWVAEVDVDSDTKISGPVVIEVENEKWIGTVARGDVYAGRAHASIVGGRGTISKTLAAKHYVTVPMASVITDVISGIGEVLSPLTGTDVLGLYLSRWSHLRAKGGSIIKEIAEEAGGASWRVLRDGTLWIGQETWLPTLLVDYDEISRAPNRGKVVIAPTSPSVRPGTTFEGNKISMVTTLVSSSEIRQELSFENQTLSALDRQRQSMISFFESVFGPRIDYTKRYPSRVIRQEADGSVELFPDDPLIRGTGIAQVPLMHGLPGCSVKVKPGSYVELYFQNGDKKLPAAGLWPDGSGVLEIELSPDLKLILGALIVQLGGSAAAQPAVLGTMLTAALVAYMNAVNAALLTIPTFISPAKETFAAATATAILAVNAALSTRVRVQ